MLKSECVEKAKIGTRTLIGGYYTNPSELMVTQARVIILEMVQSNWLLDMF